MTCVYTIQGTIIIITYVKLLSNLKTCFCAGCRSINRSYIHACILLGCVVLCIACITLCTNSESWGSVVVESNTLRLVAR